MKIWDADFRSVVSGLLAAGVTEKVERRIEQGDAELVETAARIADSMGRERQRRINQQDDDGAC